MNELPEYVVMSMSVIPYRGRYCRCLQRPGTFSLACQDQVRVDAIPETTHRAVQAKARELMTRTVGSPAPICSNATHKINYQL